MLRDCLQNTTYGFYFTDEYGKHLFETMEPQSWATSPEDRNNRIKDFYRFGKNKNAYSRENGRWAIKNIEGVTVASYPDTSASLEEVFYETQEYIRLFNGDKIETSQLLLHEIENIRAKGSADPLGIPKQKQLVYQQKDPSGRCIPEDFFDLSISIILPSWPARFQDKQLKGYIENLVIARVPCHLKTEILWLDMPQMKAFETVYYQWGKLKSMPTDRSKYQEEINASAYKVYEKLKQYTSDK